MKKKKIIEILKGIPASGKSHYALKEVENGGGSVVRINKDDLRAMLHANKFSKQREKATVNVRDTLIRNFLFEPHIQRIIIDDTNLSPKHENVINEIISEPMIQKTLDIQVKKIWFEDSLNVDLCHKRNTSRTRSVPFGVIENMYAQFLPQYLQAHPLNTWHPFEEPYDGLGDKEVVIFDIDGTLADHKGIRSPFDWKKVGEDRPHPEIINLLNMYRAEGYGIILMSGRDSQCRLQTEEWLEKYDIQYDALHMRPRASNDKDFNIKLQLYVNHVWPNCKVHLIVDDRFQVVRMWRALGIKVLSVDNGFF